MDPVMLNVLAQAAETTGSISPESARLIAAGLAIGLGALGPGLGLGIGTWGATQAIGRNPDAEESCWCETYLSSLRCLNLVLCEGLGYRVSGSILMTSDSEMCSADLLLTHCCMHVRLQSSTDTMHW